MYWNKVHIVTTEKGQLLVKQSTLFVFTNVDENLENTDDALRVRSNENAAVAHNNHDYNVAIADRLA